MSILQNSNAISAGGYDINNSLRFRSSASAYLNRTPASAGNRKTWTWSAWIKRGELSTRHDFFSAGTASNNTDTMAIRFDSSANLTLAMWSADIFQTSQLFRDPSAWYHIVLAMDTTQATASNRTKLYINGTQVTNFTSISYPSQNADLGINGNVVHNIGRLAFSGGAFYFDGYMAEVNFIDGSAKTPSDFGETDTTTGVWKPKAYTGTYGTNGFYLKFSDIATTSGSNAGLGKDFSGNSNYWTTNNISVTSGTTYDAMTDSPTLTSATVANYGTWNPLNAFNTTTTDGNLGFSMSANNTQSIQGTFGMTSGKWYFEYSFTSAGVIQLIGGIVGSAYSASGTRPYQTSTGYMYISSGNKINNGSSSAYGSTYTTNDIIGVAVDLDNGKIWFSKNGTWQASGDPAAGTNAAYTGLSGTYVPSVTNGNDGVTYDGWINCGQRPFTYTPPTGFNRLNTYNLPDSTVKKGNSYMDATLYTGNGSTQTITNAGAFKPDLVWVKARSSAIDHQLFDSVRGVNIALQSNATNAEGNYGTMSAFNSNGFTAVLNGSYAGTNQNGTTYVGWQWQAGQGSTSSNTSGSITSTVSVNTTAGFSIVTWTGTGSPGTVGHGLGVAPKMVISKKRNSTSDWAFWITGFAGTELMEMNSTSGKFTGTTVWNSTTPTSTVFSVGSATQTNNSGGTYVAYLWAEIAGFSKFGSYTGNGSADGPFVYTGFRPKYVMTKSSTSASNWAINDSTRSPSNVSNATLLAENSIAESSSYPIDILSNGFKLRTTNQNDNGQTFIYMAFAENPFKNANAR